MISLRDPRATSLPEELPGRKLKSITSLSSSEENDWRPSQLKHLLLITKRYTCTDIRYDFQVRAILFTDFNTFLCILCGVLTSTTSVWISKILCATS